MRIRTDASPTPAPRASRATPSMHLAPAGHSDLHAPPASLRFKSPRNKLMTIKLLHTAAWVFMNVVILYVLYAVLVGRIDRWSWIGLAVIGLECPVLLIFKMACPHTIVARRYSDSQLPNFDIYLPLWLAKYNKLIYGIILVCVLMGLVLRLIADRS